MAANEAYEGVTGGKFRKRPFRRAAGTPYDRPPAAARGLLARPVEEVKNGWFSRLVDPASKIINKSASMFFTSIFRKRLGAPPAAPEANLESGKEISEVVSTNLLSATEELGGKNKEDSKDNADGNGITDVEQLFKQKTFTRVEFDLLSELLRSRTIDVPVVNEKRETEPSISQLPVKEKQENSNVSAHENIIGSSNIFGSTSAPFNKSNVPEEEIVSPAELAKAYMGSRFSKLSPSTSSFQSQVPREVTTLPKVFSFAPKPFDASIVPRSVVRFSGISGPSESVYLTPRPRGRSEIYKMSRSPYFKRAGFTGDAYAGPSTSSQWTPTDVTLSRGNQVLKRRISVLDSDHGSVGPIRRIRQKYNVVSPSKDTSMSVCGKFLSTPSTLNDFDAIKGSTSSSQKPMLDGTNHVASNLQDEGNDEYKISHGRLAPIHPKSTESAMKILRHIDKPVPSPKEKSSELKAANDESLPKLTLKMLHARAPRGVEDIDSSKMHNVADNGKLGHPNATNSKKPISFASSKQESGSSKTAIAGFKLASEVNDFHDAVISVGDNMPAKRTVGFHFMNSTAVRPQNKPGFQMQALEDSVELDDYANRDSPGPTAIEREKLETAKSEQKVVTSETTLPKKLLVPSSDGEPASRSTVNKDAHSRSTNELIVAAKETGFTFPVVPSPSILPQPPPRPTMPIPLTDKAAPPKEQSFAPTFSFGSANAPTLKFSSINSSFNNSEGLKFDAKSVLKLEGLVSSTTVMTPTAPVEIPNSDKGDTTRKAGDMFKSTVNAASSAMSLSTTPIYTFGSSSSLCNGLAALSKPISSVSATPELSNRSASSSVTANGVSSTSRSASPTTFPSQPLFQFGSSASSVSTNSAPSAVVEYKSKPLESKPVKESSFGAARFSSVTPSSVISSTSSGIFGFGASAPSSATIGNTAGSLFGGIQTTQPVTGNSPFTQSTMSQFNSSASSPAFGLGGTPAITFSGLGSGPSTSSANSFGSSSGLGTSSTAGANSSIPTNSSSFPLLATASSIFNSSSQPTTQPVFGSGFGLSTSSPSTGFPLRMTPAASGSTPLSFGSSSRLEFSFASGASTTPSVSVSPSGMPTSTSGFNSGSPGNDQMNVEDSITDDSKMVRGFGQPANAPVQTIFSFSSPTVTSGREPVFQFSSQQGSAFPQSQSPSQAAGSLELPLGGNFSFGSGGGGDKSGRRMVKFRRDNKHRKKFGKSEVPEKKLTRAQRRRARARSGLSTPDEEAKKRARIARFAQYAIEGDNLAAEKRNARAIRFSQTKSGPACQANGGVCS